MKIALRTSGGRGEYELAGRYGQISATQLFSLLQFFEITPGLLVPGLAAAMLRDGKPRIRLMGVGATHAYRFLAAVLLLPEAKRELNATPPNSTLLRAGEYSITAIDVDFVGRDQSSVILRPTMIWAGNSSGKTIGIPFASRMAAVSQCWASAAELPSSPLSPLLAEHFRAIHESPQNHKSILAAASAIQTFFQSKSDILPLLEMQTVATDPGSIFGPGDDPVDLASEVIHPQNGQSPEDYDDDSTPQDSSRRQIRQWRRQVSRGVEGRKFSLRVKAAYNSRCIFTGMRLPKTSETLSPGIEAAHILPWAAFEVNSIRNGLCLNGLCHWAFDAGVLRLDYLPDPRKYRVSIPQRLKSVAPQEGIDISYFEGLEGYLSDSSLPSNMSDWPSPQYLASLNERMYGL